MCRDILVAPQHTVTVWLSRLWQTMRALYVTPFHLAARANAADDATRLEQQHRLALFRFIAVNYTVGILLVAGVLFVVGGGTPWLRWSALVVAALNSGCVALSYSRWTTLAILVFLHTSLAGGLALNRYDIDALNGRSVLIYSLISLLILTAGIILPCRLIGIVTSVMIGVTLYTALTLPLHLADPRVLVLGLLFIQYTFAALLTWMYVHSTTHRIATLVATVVNEQELLQQKDAFINIASHELRTPLTALVLACSLIQRSLRHPDRLAQVGDLTREMAAQIQQMDTSITTLLDASRMSQDQFALTKASYDLASCIRDAVAEQAQRVARHVSLEGVELPIPGTVDGPRIQQVITHLVGNALKFSPADTEVNVAVAVIHQGPAPALHVAVRDAGSGIPPSVLPVLFRRAYHARDATAELQAGFGLGLYLSGTIIHLHGGTIGVDATDEHGSIVSFEIPL